MREHPMNDASDALKKTQCAVCENNPMNDPIRPYRYEASARPYAGARVGGANLSANQRQPSECMGRTLERLLLGEAKPRPAPEPTDQQQAGHYLNAITRTTAVTLKLKRYSGTPPHPEGNSSAAFGFIWGFFRVGCCLVVAANRPPAPAQPLLQQLG